VEARFYAVVQTGPGAHPTSYTIGTGSFPEVKRPGRGVDHPSHLAPRLFPLCAFTTGYQGELYFFAPEATYWSKKNYVLSLETIR